MNSGVAKITEIDSESNIISIECKFHSKEECDKFYEIAKKQIIHKAALRNGPFFSDDENTVSIGYRSEDKEFITEFINQHSSSIISLN